MYNFFAHSAEVKFFLFISINTFEHFTINRIFFIHIIRKPAISTSNVKIFFTFYFKYTGNLTMKRSLTLVINMRVAKYRVWSMPGICDCNLRRIWKISGCTGCEQVMFPFSIKMCSGFSDIWWVYTWKMCCVITGNIGIIFGQISTDCFTVYTFKVVVSFSIRSYDQIKISTVHSKWTKSFSYFSIRT